MTRGAAGSMELADCEDPPDDAAEIFNHGSIFAAATIVCGGLATGGTGARVEASPPSVVASGVFGAGTSSSAISPSLSPGGVCAMGTEGSASWSGGS